MIKSGEFLERVVAGIQAITASDATVVWNDMIDGRQFDVTIRFTLGTIGLFVALEVKDKTRPTSAADIEAFVTKIRDHKIDKGVFVSAAGFQQGAVDVARRHSIDIFSIKLNAMAGRLPPYVPLITRVVDGYMPLGKPIKPTGRQKFPAVDQIILSYEDGREFGVPNERSQMMYYNRRTILSDGRTLGDLLRAHRPAKMTSSRSEIVRIRLEPGLGAQPPDEFFYPSGVLAEVRMRVKLGHRWYFNGVAVDESAFEPVVYYENVIDGSEYAYNFGQIPLILDPPAVGEFYARIYPLTYAICMGKDDKLVHWGIVESFQLGQMVRYLSAIPHDDSRCFVPVTEKQTIARLRERAKDFVKLMATREPVSIVPGTRWFVEPLD